MNQTPNADLVNQPVIDDGAADLLEQLVQRLNLAHADCRNNKHGRQAHPEYTQPGAGVNSIHSLVRAK